MVEPTDAPKRGLRGPEELPFEQALERLEAIVVDLESGELELEAALSRFEEGVRLSRHCEAQLRAAEQRVEILVTQAGERIPRAFRSSEGDEAGGAEGEGEEAGRSG